MDIIYRRAVTDDFKGILDLQNSNFIANLSERQLSDGFLSIEFTETQFIEINRDLAVVVAVMDNNIVGYLCGTSCAYGRQFQIIQKMMQRFGSLNIGAEELNTGNTFIYGPACVDKSVRGTGVLHGLYQTLSNLAKPRYSFCILFVADVNGRSLRAHQKIKMLLLGEFELNDKKYHLLGGVL